jgi:hypothetical protein
MRTLALIVVTVLLGMSPALASPEKLVGSWKVVDAKGPYAKGNKKQTYTFNKDGTMKISWNRGKWKLAGSELSFIYGAKGNVVIKSDVEFKGDDMLIIKIRNSDGQVLTLKKK